FRDNSSAWIWEIDRAGRVRNPSPRFAEAARRDVALLRGMPFTALFANDDSHGSTEVFAAAIDHGAPFWDLAVAVKAGTETRHWLLAGRPAGGRGGGYRGVASDVT